MFFVRRLCSELCLGNMRELSWIVILRMAYEEV